MRKATRRNSLLILFNPGKEDKGVAKKWTSPIVVRTPRFWVGGNTETTGDVFHSVLSGPNAEKWKTDELP